MKRRQIDAVAQSSGPRVRVVGEVGALASRFGCAVAEAYVGGVDAFSARKPIGGTIARAERPLEPQSPRPTCAGMQPQDRDRQQGWKGMPMLKVTAEAATLACTLVQDGPVPDDGGVRIVLNLSTDSLSMGLAATPARGDAVIARDGARLFLSPRAANRMRDRTLCAEVTAARSTFFLDR